MSTKIRSVGYYELPIPIVVTIDVLGTVCPTRIGGRPAQVHTPLAQSDDSDAAALAPRMPVTPADHPRIATPWDWVISFDEQGAGTVICLRRVGIVVHESDSTAPATGADPEGPDGPRGARLRTTVPDGMDEWVARLRTWVEVLTEQDLDRYHPQVEASYLGAGLWISEEPASDYGLAQVEPIDLRQWRAILDRMTCGEDPPLEHLLARDARAALARDDPSRAAIYAGAATEVVLHRLWRDRLGAGNGGATPAEPHGLEALQRALLEAGVDLGVPAAELDALVRARGSAIGSGVPADARDIMATMRALIGTAGQDPLHSRSVSSVPRMS